MLLAAIVAPDSEVWGPAGLRAQGGLMSQTPRPPVLVAANGLAGQCCLRVLPRRPVRCPSASFG